LFLRFSAPESPQTTSRRYSSVTRGTSLACTRRDDSLSILEGPAGDKLRS
jgi:hypothetical protein